MQHSLLLSTGEFAQMCNVSRELLVHYDKIGLLKPKEVRGNGYRYYSLKQLYLFDVVRFFMDAGMSTKEIKEYLDNHTTQLFLDSIQASIDRMGQQRDILDARIGMMEKMRYLTQRAVTFPKEQPRTSRAASNASRRATTRSCCTRAARARWRARTRSCWPTWSARASGCGGRCTSWT